jgi:L-lysine 2,3-aminomutase
MEEEIHIMTELRKLLSGLAYPTYVVDVEGKGKIPVPLDFWNDGRESCVDFEGNFVDLKQRDAAPVRQRRLRIVN